MSNNKFSNSFFEFVVMCLFACLLTYACVGCDEGTSMMMDQDMAMIVMDGGVDMADMGDGMDSDVDSDAGMEPDANVNEDMGVDMADMGPRECPAGTEDNGVACVDINDCDPNPCFPGVWCSDVPAPGVGFTCEECPAGTEGDGIVCTDADACDPNPCVNGGTCVENTDQTNFMCECTSGWSGTFCHECPRGHEISGEFCNLVPQPTPVYEFWPGYTGNIYYRWFRNDTWVGYEGAEAFCQTKGGHVLFLNEISEMPVYWEINSVVPNLRPSVNQAGTQGRVALVAPYSGGGLVIYLTTDGETDVWIPGPGLDIICLVPGTSEPNCQSSTTYSTGGNCILSPFYTDRNQTDNL